MGPNDSDPRHVRPGVELVDRDGYIIQDFARCADWMYGTGSIRQWPYWDVRNEQELMKKRIPLQAWISAAQSPLADYVDIALELDRISNGQFAIYGEGDCLLIEAANKLPAELAPMGWSTVSHHDLRLILIGVLIVLVGLVLLAFARAAIGLWVMVLVIVCCRQLSFARASDICLTVGTMRWELFAENGRMSILSVAGWKQPGPVTGRTFVPYGAELVGGPSKVAKMTPDAEGMCRIPMPVTWHKWGLYICNGKLLAHRAWAISVPLLWLSIMPFSIGFMQLAGRARLWRKIRRRRLAGHCVQCGYNLYGSNTLCPECGRTRSNAGT